MIKKLDWYILKKFFVTFVFCMLLFTLIAVAVDSSEKTDDFVKTGLTGAEIIREYYVGFVPWIWGMLYPLFVFIAVIFFTSKMALRTEIIAILASGVTYNRWLRPYLIGGLLFAGGLWFATRTYIPKANGIRSDFQSTYIDKYDPTKNKSEGGCFNCFYRRVDTNTYIGIRNWDTASQSASQFFMEKVRGNQVYYNLRADRFAWDTARRSWKLYNTVERTVEARGERLVRRPEMFIDINLKPSELRKDEYLKDKLTTPELAEYIRLEELRGAEGLAALKVEQYRRTATPFTVLLLTMIGAIIAGRKTRGGSGLHLATGIAVASIFIISDRFSTVFAVKGSFPPALAAWVPNLVFLLVAVYFYRTAPK